MDFKITNHQITTLNIDFNQAKNTNEMADMLLSFNINTANKGITYYFNFIGIMNFRVRRKIPINYVTLHPLFESPRNCFDFISAFF